MQRLLLSTRSTVPIDWKEMAKGQGKTRRCVHDRFVAQCLSVEETFTHFPWVCTDRRALQVWNQSCQMRCNSATRCDVLRLTVRSCVCRARVDTTKVHCILEQCCTVQAAMTIRPKREKCFWKLRSTCVVVVMCPFLSQRQRRFLSSSVCLCAISFSLERYSDGVELSLE